MNHGTKALTLACLSLAACGRDSGQPAQPTAAPHVKFAPKLKRGPSPDQLTAGMVEAVTIGSSAAPVIVKFEIPQPPVVGQPVEVKIAVMPQISAERAILAVAPSDELTLPAAAAGAIEMPSVEPDQVYRNSVKVTPTVAGLQILGLSVALKHDEVTESRTFSIPVIVAPAGATATLKR